MSEQLARLGQGGGEVAAINWGIGQMVQTN